MTNKIKTDSTEISHQYEIVVATRSLWNRVIVVNYVSTANQTSTVQQQPQNIQQTAERSPLDHTFDSTKEKKKTRSKIKEIGKNGEEGTRNQREREREKTLVGERER